MNDGVRLNVRPFVEAGVLRAKFNVKWDKDRGKNPDGSERLNDLHFALAEKQAPAKEHIMNETVLDRLVWRWTAPPISTRTSLWRHRDPVARRGSAVGDCCCELQKQRRVVRYGTFDATHSQGPAYWLRCVIAATVELEGCLTACQSSTCRYLPRHDAGVGRRRTGARAAGHSNTAASGSATPTVRTGRSDPALQ